MIGSGISDERVTRYTVCVVESRTFSSLDQIIFENRALCCGPLYDAVTPYTWSENYRSVAMRQLEECRSMWAPVVPLPITDWKGFNRTRKCESFVGPHGITCNTTKGVLWKILTVSF